MKLYLLRLFVTLPLLAFHSINGLVEPNEVTLDHEDSKEKPFHDHLENKTVRPIGDESTSKNKESKSPYWALGITLGTPSSLQLNLWYIWEVIGLQVSAGYLDSAYGFQMQGAWIFHDLEHFVHAAFIGVGYSSVTNSGEESDITNRWQYTMLGYNINMYGLFLEIVLTIGTGDYSNPQFGGQFGYVYRFNSHRKYKQRKTRR